MADLVDRLVRDDAALSSLTILRFRKFGASEVSSLCEALKKNRTLTELNASGHQMSGETAKVVAEMLAANSTLTSLCVGDTNFGAALPRARVFRAHHTASGSAFCLRSTRHPHRSLPLSPLTRPVPALTRPGDAGVSGLAGGLRANTALRRLDLENKVSHLPLLDVPWLLNHPTLFYQPNRHTFSDRTGNIRCWCRGPVRCSRGVRGEGPAPPEESSLVRNLAPSTHLR